jgi:1,4-alpha-glucan branching enzyme
MKGSMINKMPGTRPQKFANLRALYAYMWAHPGKKLLFMGGELGQWREWNYEQSLDWHLLDEDEHRGLRQLVRDLNRLLTEHPALYELDVEPRGFRWLDVDNALENVVAFTRFSSTGEALVCVCNFSAVARHGYRFGLPEPGTFRLVLNTDSAYYAGTGSVDVNSVESKEQPWHHQPYSAAVDLPPLAALWFVSPPKEAAEETAATDPTTAMTQDATTERPSAAPTTKQPKTTRARKAAAKTTQAVARPSGRAPSAKAKQEDETAADTDKARKPAAKSAKGAGRRATRKKTE